MEEKTRYTLKNLVIVGMLAVVFIGIGILFASRLNWTPITVAEGEKPAEDEKVIVPEEKTRTGQPSWQSSPFVKVAQQVTPAVVNITAQRKVSVRSMLPFDFWEWEPFKDMFPQHKMEPQKSQKAENFGSGIIISQDGYILTNNHLVVKAEKVTVKLADNREFDAEIVGTDPETDVALVKIDGKLDKEVVAKLGNSDKIEVGDWAIAIGRPFLLDHTVTVGVISAKGRSNLIIEGGGPRFQNFIQTDASINPGNSGGPLVNIKGEVIGVNTAVNTRGQGIGFAIPINMARRIADELKEKGKISRGYLGMYPVELTADKKEALGLPKDVKGIFVDRVEKDTPAKEGGLEAGDVIVEFDGQKVSEVTRFRLMVADHHPGDVVKAKVIRNGKEIELEFKLADRGEYTRVAQAPGKKAEEEVWLGIQVESLKGRIARRWGIKEDKGVLVVGIVQDSPAEDILQPRDVIIEVDKKEINDLDDYYRVTEDIKSRKKAILFRIIRDGLKTFKAVKP